MRDAFQFGQHALNLYYYDDTHANKEEVESHQISFSKRTLHDLLGHLQRSSSSVYYWYSNVQ
jgi:hypothetical protein